MKRAELLLLLPSLLLVACHQRRDFAAEYGRTLRRPATQLHTLRQQGPELFTRFGCVGCHTFPGSPGPHGLSLEGVGYRDVNLDGRVNALDAAWLEDHFLAPSEMRSGSYMPSFSMTSSQAEALTLLMLDFVEDEVPADLLSALSVPTGGDAVARGAALFRRAGCPGCHGPDGTGGVRDPNRGGIPSLTNYAETLVTDEEAANALMAKLKAAAPIDSEKDKQFDAMKALIDAGVTPAPEPEDGPPPLIAMPSYHDLLSSRDLEEIGAYIMSLFPEDGWESWD